MVEAAPSGRAQIQQELLAKADALFATWDTAPTVFEDASRNYVAKQVIQSNNQGVTLIKYRADGLTLEEWERWRQDPTAIGCAVNPKVTRTVLPEVDGHKCVHVKMKMPVLISNRSIISTFYE